MARPLTVKQKNDRIKADHYLGNPKLKRAGVNISLTPEQLVEYERCMNDVVYFARNYIKIVHVDHGLVPFDMWGFQEELLTSISENRFSIVTTARQVGKTTTTSAFILHYILFNEYKLVGILANKEATAREILGRIQLAYENLPKWMQQGVEEWNKGSLELENGCRVMAASTSSSTVRGYSFSCLFVDEAAFIPTNIWEEFYESVYPTISSGKKTKVILVSTPNGLNHYYKLWEDAQKDFDDGGSSYVPFMVTWRSVPDRDELWRKETIANTSDEQFLQEHECQFIGASNTLISTTKLKDIPVRDPIRHNDNFTLRIYEDAKPDHGYIVIADVARGRGLDNSAASVIDITEYPFRQVATFYDSKISPLLFPEILQRLGQDYNNAYILVESNDIGEQVANILNYEFEYENLISTKIENRVSLGVRTTKSVKSIGCSNLKDLVEGDKLIFWDYTTLYEMSTFVTTKTSYQAEEGHHDDLVMTLVLFSWFINSDYYKDLSNTDFRKHYSEMMAHSLEEDMLPSIHIDDGLDDEWDYFGENSGSWGF